VSRAALRRPAARGGRLCTAPTRCRSPPTIPGPRCRAWQEGAEARHALRGSARLAVDGEGPPCARQILVVERPSRLRVEVQGCSQTLACSSRMARATSCSAPRTAPRIGRGAPGLLWQVASLDLTPEEAIDLCSRPRPARPGARGASPRGGEIGVELAEPDGRVRERRVFDAQGRLRGVERVGEDGAAAWSARFDEYQPVGGVPFAHAIRVEAGRRATRAELVLSGVELNPALPADIFQLRPVGSGGQADGEGG
jgi:hypothetical protein